MKKLTKKQTALLDQIKTTGMCFNDFDVDLVIKALKDNANLWIDGVYDDDTLLLLPRKGQEDRLQLMAYKYTCADEIDLFDTGHRAAYLFNTVEQGPFVKGDISRIEKKPVVRLWWD